MTRSTLAALIIVPLVGTLALVNGQPPDAPPLDDPLVVSGVVIDVERDRTAARVLLAEPIAYAGGRVHTFDRPLRVTFDYVDPPPVLGQVIRFDALLARPRQPANPSTVPPREPPLFALGLTTPQTDSARRASWATTVRLALHARLTFESEPATALFRALLLGDRSDLDAGTRYAFQDTGTAHLLAISGMHLALIGWGLFRILLLLSIALAHTPGLRHLGVAHVIQGHRPRLLAAIAAISLTAAYTAIIAPSDATRRALIALALAMLAILLVRATTAWRVLVACLLATFALSPAALSGAGCQLSFAAAAGLVIVAPHLAPIRAYLGARIRRPWLRRLAIALAALLVADIACFLATAPLTIAWFGQLPFHSLWVNLFAIPMLTLLVLPAGALWLVLATLVPPLGDALAPVVVVLGDAFTDLVRLAGDASGLASTESWPLALAVVGCLALLMLMTLRRTFVRLGGLALALVTLLAIPHTSPPEGLSLTALDVGHGDALALGMPDGTRVLVDTGGRRRHRAFGGDPNRHLAERVLVPSLRASGFGSIDLLVLTHADLDHVGAAQVLAERVPIRHLWLPPCATSPTLEALIAALSARGTRIHRVARGPPSAFGGASLEVLHPPAGGPCPKDNDGSLVLRLGFAGRHILLTGDIEADAEAALLASHAPARLAADFLKVPHHGSRTSSSEALLDAVRPRVAIVPAARPGPRPPPHEEVLERYRRRGIPTYITGRDGATRVRIGVDGGLEVDR